MGKRAALYARYSSEGQRIESITAQLRASHDYCAKKQYQIVQEYRDEAESGRTDDRPAFQKMIRDAKTKMFDVVVYHKIDRNSRNEFDYYFYKRELQKHGVGIEYAEQNIDDSPEGQAMEAMLVGFAAYYSRNLAREAKKGMRENAYQCLHNGGAPPLGYDVGPDKKLFVNEIEAVAIRKIFKMRAAGSGYGKIIETLNAEGHKTKKGNSFLKNSLHDILANKKYVGTYVFGRTATSPSGKRNNHKAASDAIEIENAIPAIIDQLTWDKVQRQRKRDSEKRQGGQYQAKEEYLLTGLIQCSCGSAMNGSRTKNQRSGVYTYYKCAGQHNGTKCPGKRIKKAVAEQAVIDVLLEQINKDKIPKILHKVNAAMLSFATDLNAELKVLDAKKPELERNIEKALRLYYDDVLPKTEVGRIVNEARATINGIDERLAEIHRLVKSIYLNEDQLFDLLLAFSSDLKAGQNLKEIIRAFVEYVVVIDEATIEVHLWLGPDFWRPMGEGSPPPFKSTFDKKPRTTRFFCCL